MDTFTTPRLSAYRLHPRHFDDLAALHLDPEVSRYIGGVRSREATAAYLDVNIAHWDQHGFGLWALETHDGAFVGRAGLRYVTVNAAPEVEIAYALARPFWAQGLASEIAAALVRIGFERLGLSSLVGLVVVGHAGSCHVLEKAGFVLEGRSLLNGAECVVYRLTNPQPGARQGASTGSA